MNQKDQKLWGGERCPRTVLILLPTSYLLPSYTIRTTGLMLKGEENGDGLKLHLILLL
jgi:hypothetical protein